MGEFTFSNIEPVLAVRNKNRTLDGFVVGRFVSVIIVDEDEEEEFFSTL